MSLRGECSLKARVSVAFWPQNGQRDCQLRDAEDYGGWTCPGLQGEGEAENGASEGLSSGFGIDSYTGWSWF